MPDVAEAARKAELFGAQGITVHPRPDQRHITYRDIEILKEVVQHEFNVEGFPSKSFLDLVCTVKPDQVTLVPDAPDAITSDAGWNTIKNLGFLKEVVHRLHEASIRVSVFLDTNLNFYEAAAETGTDRIELYTEAYAKNYSHNPDFAIKDYISAANKACELGLGINAGHDLNRFNLKYFATHIPQLQEVSIGHALISDALYLGFENTIQIYLRQLQ